MAIEQIVVAVDGSQNSNDALKWAAGEAEAHMASLRVVHAWEAPIIAVSYATPTGVYDYELYEKLARGLLDSVVEQVDQDRLIGPIEKVLVKGSAAPEIINSAKDADLLVLGQRGRGGFTGLLLGSVSQQVVHHAPCPVVILPHHDK